MARWIAPKATESTRATDPGKASEPTEGRFRRSWVVGGMMITLLLGLGIGWSVRGDDVSESSYLIGNTVVSGNELTERQVEMVEVAERYVDAWIESDGDAVASFVVPSGSVAFPTLGMEPVRADDGTLQDWVEQTGQIPNELNDPIIVQDNRVVLVGRASLLGEGPANVDWMISLEFTGSGDVMISSDTHWADLR